MMGVAVGGRCGRPALGARGGGYLFGVWLGGWCLGGTPLAASLDRCRVVRSRA